MSQIAPGWYPDATGRFAQRYHDGSNWTEHVSDAAGNRGTDPLAPAAPAMPVMPVAPSGGPPAPGFGAGYGAPPFGAPAGAPASTGFTPTIGLITAGVGGLLVLLSLFVLDFVSGGGVGITLGDVADLPDFFDVPAAVDTYASFGRFLAILVVIFAVVVSARILPPLNAVVVVPIIAAALCGVLALWHLAAMFVDLAGASPTVGAYVGVVGWIVLAASPFLKIPITGSR